MNRITDRYQTRLDKLLSVFEQTNFVDDKKITKEFTHATDIEEVGLMTDSLHYSGTDPGERNKIETEQEAWRTVEALTEGLREKVLEQSKVIKEKDQALTEKDLLIAELLRKLDEKK